MEIVTSTLVNSERFYALLAQSIGYSATKYADSLKKDPKSFESFMLALQQAKNRESKDIESWVGKHLSFGILLNDSKEAILESSTMHTLSVSLFTSRIGSNITALLTGSLLSWKAATLICCTATASADIRRIYCEIWSGFERAGLGFYWSDYRKKPYYNDSWILEKK